MVFGVAAATTTILSLDATMVLLTPVVLATVRTLSVPAEPHAYATAHLANSASLLLPVSNLTNLLAFTAAGLTGDSDANASRTTGINSSATSAAACASPNLRSHWCRGCVRIVGRVRITGSAGGA